MHVVIRRRQAWQARCAQLVEIIHGDRYSVSKNYALDDDAETNDNDCVLHTIIAATLRVFA